MAAQRKYPEELRERAVKMVFEIREQDGKGHGELARVGRQLGVHPEALRSWVKQAKIDGGGRPGTTSGDKQRLGYTVNRSRLVLWNIRAPGRTTRARRESSWPGSVPMRTAWTTWSGCAGRGGG